MNSKDKIESVLRQNGINSIEDLSRMLADDTDSPSGSVVKIDPGSEVGLSYFIKIFKLSSKLDDFDVQDIPMDGNMMR